MNIRTKKILSVFLSLAVLFSSSLAQRVEVAYSAELTEEQAAYGWNPQKGDWIIVNVENNTLQFVREDHSKVSNTLQVGSGKKGGPINYLGMRYLPATPEKVWEIRSKHQQNWCRIFCNPEKTEQLFMRLYEVRGDQRIYSHYGIHSIPNIEELIEINDGFNSWGCVLTRYQLLKFIEIMYELNEGSVRVVTTKQSTSSVLALVSAFE